MAAKSNKGQIGVTTENIFPVIKQFLYSDHEIFLRELVANAVDASQKMKAIASNGDFKGELGELKVRVELDEKAKTLRIIDSGIGMTDEEIDRYINQIAFSSAGEFLQKYKDQNIIGHFGLGFYSAFMVAKKVTIESLSWKEGSSGVIWTCEGNPEFEMGPCDKAERGTVITRQICRHRQGQRHQQDRASVDPQAFRAEGGGLHEVLPGSLPDEGGSSVLHPPEC